MSKNMDELFEKALLVINSSILNGFTKKKLDKYLLANESFINENYNQYIKNKSKATKAKKTKAINKKVKEFKEDLLKNYPLPNSIRLKEITDTFNKIENDLIKKAPEINHVFSQTKSLKLILKREFSLKKTISEGYLYEPNKYVICTNQNVEANCRLVFTGDDEDENGQNKGFITVNISNDFSISNIVKILNNNVVNKHVSASSSATKVFYSAMYFVTRLSVKGGCAGREHIKGNSINIPKIRIQLGLGEKDMIKVEDIKKVAEYFECSYIVINQNDEIIEQNEIIEYQQCTDCGRNLLCSNTSHKCTAKRVTFFNRQKMKKHDYVDLIDPSDNTKISRDEMIFFDLETFQESICHVPYACGYSYGDHKDVTINYGKDCMDSFLNHIIQAENKIICAFNGSGFDFHILLNFLKDRGVEIRNLIISNGAILKFTFGKEGKENKVFDLYRFINDSLASACDAYKIENKKMKFDVLKIQSWELSELYKHEVEPYLKYDVLSLSELFFTFNDSIYNHDSVNITKYVTISSMAYALWQKTLEDVLIELPELEKYHFIRKGIYGARCYPMQEKYKSKHYDEIIAGTMKYNELKQTGDYIFNADATSLYPASMAGFDLCDVNYPVGKSRWIEQDLEKEFNDKKYGFYEINFECPRNILIPVLPRKTDIGGLECNQLSELYYNSKTGLSNADKLYKKAIEIGLKVTKKEVKEFVDKQFVDQIFKQQKRSEVFSSITADKIRDEYQMDIIVYDRYEYHKYKYILCIIDIHSRYAFAKPMTTRKNETIMKKIKEIFDEMGKPKLISCDNEFATNEFNKYCTENDIDVNYSEPNDIQKNSIVERFNRTLAGYIQKLRVGLKNYDWPSELDDILYNYNTSYHKTIKNTPNNIFHKKGDSLMYSKDDHTIIEKLGSGKYRLENDKIYVAKNLKKVSDIIEYNPDKIINEQETEHENLKQSKKVNKILKKVGIDTNLVIETKRISKKKEKLDL
eukprot:gene13573-18215_t